MLTNKNKNFLKTRRNRVRILNNLVQFTRGDIVSINYRLRGIGFVFTGLCIAVKKKSMLLNNTTFKLRNILGKVAVEIHFNLYSLCRGFYTLLNFARKKIYYKSAKLYYLRKKPNKESWVKE